MGVQGTQRLKVILVFNQPCTLLILVPGHKGTQTCSNDTKLSSVHRSVAQHFAMALLYLLASVGSTPTTPQCDALGSTIASTFTLEHRTTYRTATSPECLEVYNLYSRDQVIGHTASTGWAADDPAVGSAGWSLVSHGIGEKLFTLNSNDELVPSLASGIVRSGNDWVLTLKPGRKFSDGTSITATYVRDALNRTNHLLSAAQTEVGNMTFVVQDALNLQISTTIPYNLEVVLANWPFVIYKEGPSGDIETSRVFSGPYAIASTSLDANGAIHIVGGIMDLVPNIHHPGASARVPMKIRRYATSQEVGTALQTGQIDLGFNLGPADVPLLNWHSGVEVKSFLSGYTYMAHFNTQRAALSDVNVRRALTLAIDRPALAAAIALNGLPSTLTAGMPATGAFPSSTIWGSIDRQPAFDMTQAEALLDAAGWIVDVGDGIRKKDGVNLALDIVYYTFRADLVTMAPLIQASYIALGIQATIRVNDVGNFMDGDGPDSGFDVLLWAQHTLPAGDPYWFLNTFFRSSPPEFGNWGTKNFAQINSTTIDAALDAITTSSGEAWSTAVHTAHDAILDEYPVTFLSGGVWHAALNERMSSYEPWGSDYYIIKEDMPASICSVCTDLSALIPVPPPSPPSLPPPPPPPSPVDTGAHVTIGVLAGVTFLVLISIVILYTINKKKASAVSNDQGKPKQVSAA